MQCVPSNISDQCGQGTQLPPASAAPATSVHVNSEQDDNIINTGPTQVLEVIFNVNNSGFLERELNKSQ